MSNIISAADARKKTEQGIKNLSMTQLENIMAQIKQTANKGESSFTQRGLLKSDVKKQLEDLGYRVIRGTLYDNCYFTIIWE